MAKANSPDADPANACPSRPELDALYRTHGGWLIDFLRRRFGREAAEELAQETYVRLARAGADVQSPKAFLATTALNAARDQARRRAVRPRLVHEDDLPEPGSAPNQAEALLLKQVVLSLPRNLREVFLLSRFGGMTYEEIAQQCGVSVKTVEARMTKALRFCTARLRT